VPIQPEKLLSHIFPDIGQAFVERDVILYALGVGLGRDPLAQEELAFLLEGRLQVLPTYAVTLGSPGMWIRDPAFGIDFAKLVHAEQTADFHAPLPTRGNIVASAKVLSLTDRGAGRGAVLTLQRIIRDASTAMPYCTLRQTLLLRGDGGFGGPAADRTEDIVPERPADRQSRFDISPRAALIYRLSGDWNPLHADPDFAAKAGFSKPILHGLASYGIASIAVARALGLSPAIISRLSCRFSGVVYPGESLEFHIWNEQEGAVFQAFAHDRKVLDQGSITFREST